MPICISRLGLAIYTSPKVLSTSLKYFAFELENGRPFEELRKAGHQNWVHRHYPARPFEPVDRNDFPHVVAFVRDPVRRFVSMYRNRVVKNHAHTAESWRRAEGLGLEGTPTFSDFMANFDQYDTLVPDVRHHALPQVEYLGTDSAYFDATFTETSVSQFESLVHGLSGATLRLPWVQRSDTDAPVPLDNDALSWIRDRYSEDYRVFGEWFPPASRWARGRSWWNRAKRPKL